VEDTPQLQDHIQRHRDEVLAFVKRRAPRDAEELAQETWLRIARRRPVCPDEASFRGYVFTVARRVLIDHYRRSAARPQLVPLDTAETSPQHAHPGDHPDARRDMADVLTVVEGTLKQMKPELAEVFRWRTTQDLTFKEIARRQGVSVNTALGRMHQAVKKLHRALSAQGLVPTSGGA